MLNWKLMFLGVFLIILGFVLGNGWLVLLGMGLQIVFAILDILITKDMANKVIEKLWS